MPRPASHTALDRVDARSLFDQLHDSIVVTDLSGQITDWSRGAETLSGWPADEAIGRPMEFLLQEPEARQTLSQLIERVLSGESGEAEFDCCRKDGGQYACRLSLALLRDRAGAPCGMLGVASETTDQHEVNRRLQAALRDRDVLIQEVHHRVFNNFQVVSSLLSLHARELQCPRCEDAMRRACLRVDTMARVHGGLYQQRDVSKRVPLQKLLSDVMRTVGTSHGLSAAAVALSVQPADADVAMKQAVALAMLTSELSMYLLARVGGADAVRLAVDYTADTGRSLSIGLSLPRPPQSRAGSADAMNTFMIPSLVDQLGGRLDWHDGGLKARLRW